MCAPEREMLALRRDRFVVAVKATALVAVDAVPSSELPFISMSSHDVAKFCGKCHGTPVLGCGVSPESRWK